MVISSNLTSARKIYADNEDTGALIQIPITASSPSTNQSNLILSETGAMGAGTGSRFYRVNSTRPESTNASFFWQFTRSYNANSDTNANSMLKFYRRSTNASGSNIKVKLERVQSGSGSATPGIEKSFTANGDWQEIIYPFGTNTFTTNSADVLEDIYKVIFVLSDANGTNDGIGSQTFDIDEIHFANQ